MPKRQQTQLSFRSSVQRKTLRAGAIVQQLQSQNVKSRMVQQIIEQRSLLSNAGSEHDLTDLLQASDAAGRKEAFASRVRSGMDAKDKNVQLSAKLNSIKLEIRKLRQMLTVRGITIKAMTSTIKPL